MATSTPPGAGTETRNSMEGHVKGVAIINLVFGALYALVAIFVVLGLAIGGVAVNDSERYGAPEWVADMLASLAIFLGIFFALVAALHIGAGLAQLDCKASGKSLGMFAAVVLLIFSIPAAFAGVGLIGLGAAIYMLVILTRPDTDRLLVN